ncbi:Nucleus export protein BRR6 [Astathelohania contejeani]|uniref:Nucleus export protein BRR6 n=1 Tax=Astathelohania contejeani TaxID=164912 RepID=A0ABQ7HYW5_9MICR|nr:Nucleus export protein BRR6 [Thelohania contejeani]
MKPVPMDVELELKWEDAISTQAESRSPVIKKRKSYAIKPVSGSGTIIQPSSSSNVFSSSSKTNQSFFIDFPLIMIRYLHLLLNFIVIFLLSYILISLVLMLKNDIKYKIDNSKQVLRGIIEESRRKYMENRCDPSTRPPALRKQCMEWECMMNRNENSIEMSKIMMEVVGELVDGFIQKVSYKSVGLGMIFLIIFLKYRNCGN